MISEKDLEEYNNYCSLVSQLDIKNEELNDISNRKSRLNYEVESLKDKIKKISEKINLSPENIKIIKAIRMKSCLKSVVSYSRGGEIDKSPIYNFKQSEEYKDFTNEQKELFGSVEVYLSESQYSLQNAIMIGQDDDSSFDVYDSSVIEDYIDGIMSEIPDYDDISMKNLKEIKKIMYIFVEQVSKN